MTAADPRIADLAEMGQCAYRLGMAFGAAAEQAQGTDQWLTYFNAFDRCFFSVRVGIALQLRLERHPAAERAEPASDRETLSDREVLSDPDDGDDRLPIERDRDRETERASFPILIRALEGICADAALLPGPEPAELPTLRDLLAQVKAAPSAPIASAMTPNLRTRLAGSGAATLTLPPRSPPSRPGWRGSG